MEQRKLLSPADVASLLGVDRRSVYKMSRLGQIPGRLKLRPKVLRFDGNAIEDWLRSCSKEPASETGHKVDRG
jgi:predicted DNA-binding transcriptional regulator AlpA